jgi:hypothetical protein
MVDTVVCLNLNFEFGRDAVAAVQVTEIDFEKTGKVGLCTFLDAQIQKSVHSVVFHQDPERTW